MSHRLQQRTSVIIALMAVVLFAVGVCVAPAQPAMHGCFLCAHMHTNMPCGNEADCCKTGPQTPPAAVTPVFSLVASLDAVAECGPAGVDAPIHKIVTDPTVLSQSPPGFFSLRI